MSREYRNINIRERNTFGIDVSCARLAEFSSADELRGLFMDGSLAEDRWTVLSGGSNIVFMGDYPGTLLHPVNDEITVVSQQGDTVIVRAGAGTGWDVFTAWCAGRGLWGVENLSGIPGLVGASPVQNIGAYGVEAKDSIHSVEMFAVDSLKELTMAAGHCGFGYRDSVFKHSLKGKVVITAVNFVLSGTPRPMLGYGDLHEKVVSLGGPSLENIRRAVVEIRNSKLPDPSVMGNAGSFFKNPVVSRQAALDLKAAYPDMPLYPAGREGFSKLAAGWLIDRCGWKGRRHGRVGVHERQALVLVNLGGASGADVMELASLIQKDVESRFGVSIETEVNFI